MGGRGLSEYEQYLREVAYSGIGFGGDGEDSESGDGRSEDTKIVPGYLQPSMAQMVGGNVNYEADVIREAYSSANYTSMRDLPDRMRPGEVALSRQMKLMEQQQPQQAADLRLSHPAEALRQQRSSLRKNGLFHEFEYVPSRYTLQKEHEAQERMRSRAKALAAGGGRSFVCAVAGRKLKHEDSFASGSTSGPGAVPGGAPRDYRFPYQSSPYDARLCVERQERKAESALVLHGAFRPAGRAAKARSDATTKQELPEVLKALSAVLLRDWDDCTLEVAEAGDLVQARFEVVALAGQLYGLRAYMNTLEASNREIQRFGLQKSGPDWNKQPGDGWVYFAFRPPWASAVTN